MSVVKLKKDKERINTFIVDMNFHFSIRVYPCHINHHLLVFGTIEDTDGNFRTCTMCDIRIASEDAKFSESFLRIGIIPGDGGSWFLPKIIGLSRATEMILTCEVLNAKKALDWGLVSQVVPNEHLLKTAFDLADKIVQNPPQSIRRAKRLLRLTQNTNFSTALEMAASQQTLLQMTTDHKEAIEALIQKRKPNYKNT